MAVRERQRVEPAASLQSGSGRGRAIPLASAWSVHYCSGGAYPIAGVPSTSNPAQRECTTTIGPPCAARRSVCGKILPGVLAATIGSFVPVVAASRVTQRELDELQPPVGG